ncbi:hypothetical protein [Frankia sp. CpI1-P]|uniref:hypothetical protein n=1 Tax=Frankia sp. CpI1-P TaxID=1502734 RepID=UPI0005D0ECBC|nr:hypothetical protein [Frankia sp. CpI1-P]KQC35700.1 hypothetical protein UK82_24640 [Frankia sp. ACN1ag]
MSGCRAARTSATSAVPQLWSDHPLVLCRRPLRHIDASTAPATLRLHGVCEEFTVDLSASTS